jgi:putative transposase
MRPKREHGTNNQQTYMVTTSTWERRALFRNEHWARLLIDTLYHYRGSAYLLHEFVIMPDHIHLLITPVTSLEKAVQFIKGGFSYRAKNELGSNLEIWQKGFQDHRIRDAKDYEIHLAYIRGNPMRQHLCVMSQEYPYCSAHSGFELDDEPQRLKPLASPATDGAPEGAPFQTNAGAAQAAPFQSVTSGTPEPARFQTSQVDVEAAAVAPVQSKKASASTRERQRTNDQRLTPHAQTH